MQNHQFLSKLQKHTPKNHTSHFWDVEYIIDVKLIICNDLMVWSVENMHFSFAEYK